jgi:hypothetical protein
MVYSSYRKRSCSSSPQYRLSSVRLNFASGDVHCGKEQFNFEGVASIDKPRWLQQL